MPFARVLKVFTEGELFVAGAMEDGDCVGEQFRDGVERFHGATRAAWEVYDDCLSADNSYSA